jgi:hypothetical protein
MELWHCTGHNWIQGWKEFTGYYLIQTKIRSSVGCIVTIRRSILMALVVIINQSLMKFHKVTNYI